MSLGHAFFAVTMIALGIMVVIKGGFVPIWTGVPRTWPARTAVAYLCGVVSLVCGIGVLLRPTRRSLRASFSPLEQWNEFVHSWV